MYCLRGGTPCNPSSVIEGLCGTNVCSALISDFALSDIDILAEQVNTAGNRVVVRQGDQCERIVDSVMSFVAS